jgi:hypothetical protein
MTTTRFASKYIHLSVLLVACHISCATVDISVKDDIRASAPKTVLLGDMENRVMDFNPFVVKNISDALVFEFFSRGYTVKRAPSLGKEAAELISAHGADLFITGSIFEARYGDAIEDRTSTAVLLMMYNKSGAPSGSCRIVTDETLADADVVRRVARKLATAIHDAVRVR